MNGIKKAIICSRCGKTTFFSYDNVRTMTRRLDTYVSIDCSKPDRCIALCDDCVRKLYDWLDALEKEPEK